MTRNILVIGHSHIHAIRAAAIARREAAPDRPRTRTIHLFDPAIGGEWEPGSDFSRFSSGLVREILTQIERHDPVIASVIGGNVHAAVALIRTDHVDFHLADDESLPIDPTARLIGEAEVRTRLEEALTSDLVRLRLLRALVGPFRHLEPPPPVRRSDWIRDHAEPFFSDDPAFHQLGIAEAGYRYRVWKLSCRIVRDHCERLGCGYVEAPAHVRGAAGLLRPSHGKDATHGNVHFGEAMLQALEQAAAADPAR